MKVWYAAYGSNLLADRFLTYLRGGRAPGAMRDQRGARDRRDPMGDQRYMIERTLMFGRSAQLWGGGGVCFLDGSPEPRLSHGPTYGRAWLLTVEQLADVWMQENGAPVADEVDLGPLEASGMIDAAFGGWYRRLLYLGELDGYPVATITCDALPDLNASGNAYLEVVGRGLIETWGLGADESAAYLASRPGNDGLIDVEALAVRLTNG